MPRAPLSFPNAESLIRHLIYETTAVIAHLLYGGYAEIPYHELREIMFMGLSDAMAELGMPRQETAALLGVHPRTHYGKRSQSNASAPEDDKPCEATPLYWAVLLYLSKNKEGVTQTQLLEYFGAQRDGVLKRRLFAVLRALERSRRVWRTGGPGSTTVYVAPTADLPTEDPKAFEAACQDHIKAVGETLIATYKQVVHDQSQGAFVRTFRFDEQPESGRATKIRKLMAELVAQLDAWWEESEAERLDKKDGRVVVYAGQHLQNERVVVYMGQYLQNGHGGTEAHDTSS